MALKLDKYCTLSYKFSRYGGRLASNNVKQSTLVFCQCQNALLVDHCSGKQSVENR